MSLPEQDELRRRLKAARHLAGYTSIAALAATIPAESELGERTLRGLEAGEAPLRPPALRELAFATGVPYEWFTVPSVPDAVAAGADTAARLRELEDAVAGLLSREQLAAVRTARTATEATPPTTTGARGRGRRKPRAEADGQ